MSSNSKKQSDPSQPATPGSQAKDEAPNTPLEPTIIQPNQNIDTQSVAEKSQEIINDDNPAFNNQQSAASEPTKKVLVRKKFIVVLSIIVGLVILFPLIAVPLLKKATCPGLYDAENQITEKTKFIEEMYISDFTRYTLEKTTGGDCVTASAGSAGVMVELTGGPKTGTQIEGDVDAIMSDKGYTKQEEYYGFSRNYNYEKDGQEITWIGTYYDNGNQRYSVNYYLNEPFVCTKDIACLDPWGSYNGSGSEVDKFKLDTLLERSFKKISINSKPADGRLP